MRARNYTPAAGTVPGSGLQLLQVVFTPTDSADYNSVTALATIDVGGAPEPSSNGGLNPLLADEVFLAFDLALVQDGWGPLLTSLGNNIAALNNAIQANPTYHTSQGFVMALGTLDAAFAAFTGQG